MPKPYNYDLCWRIMWISLSQNLSSSEISPLLSVSEHTVHRYLSLFRQTGDVQPLSCRNGPEKLLGDFEQLALLRLILKHPGIYLQELQDELFELFGVIISVSTICRTLGSMGCTRQAMHHIALQRSDSERAKLMAEISVYDPSMFVWLDETGCDRRNTIRKYGYSFRGMSLEDHRLLIRGVRYSAIPVMSLDGIHDVYLAEGSVNGEKFTDFILNCLLLVLMPFNGVNPRSVVIMDNANIHHVEEVTDLIETVAGARLCFLPPYSPDLMPAEGVFSQIKSIMKLNDKLSQATL